MSQKLGGLAKLFNRSAITVPPEAKENNENIDVNSDYKQANKSLVNKNASLKNEVATLKMRIGELRKELIEKDEKIALLESNMDQEKIDLLVAERFKRKMNHVSAVTERAILSLNKAAEEYQTVFLGMKSSVVQNTSSDVTILAPPQRKCPVPRPKAMELPNKPTLNKIEESPLVRNRPECLPAATPRATNVTVRRTPKAGRISLDENPANNVNATPKAAPRPRSISNVTAETTVDTDTVPRKRAAASKITSFAEPRLNSKLRRPDKYDEPTPYISTEFI